MAEEAEPSWWRRRDWSRFIRYDVYREEYYDPETGEAIPERIARIKIGLYKYWNWVRAFARALGIRDVLEARRAFRELREAYERGEITKDEFREIMSP